MDNVEGMEPAQPATAPAGTSRWRHLFSSATIERLAGRPLSRGEKVALGLMLVVFLFIFYVTLDANKYAAQVRVVEGEGRVGVNPTTERLDFGDLSRGTATARSVVIENNTPLPFYVTVLKVGSISDLVKQNANNFLLAPGAERKVEFTVFVPASAEIDRLYTGRVFVFKIPAPFFSR